MENKKFVFYANQSVENIFKDLSTSTEGLSDAEVKRRFDIYGPNQIQETTITWIEVLKNQIKNPFFLIFIVIAAIYFFTYQYTECIILIFIMLINITIGFYQEYRSNQAMILLKSYLQETIIVSRNNKNERVTINTLVPGDIIQLKAGDIIPADCRFIATENCIVDESMLTGESMPVKKEHILSDTKITELYNAYTIGYAGTIITDGNATAVVFATGSLTMFGNIALLTTRTITQSALVKGTMQLAQIILGLVVFSLIIIVIINLLFNHQAFSSLHFLLFAGALAITAVPSALPIVITFCLTQGAMVLHKHKMIIKRLSVIEDLGSIEVFCTDKTGTLTENVLSVKNIYSTNEPHTLLYAACTETILLHSLKDIHNGFDQAIIKALTTDQVKMLDDYTLIKELPFTYERHRAITLVQKNGTYILITKGSFEYVIPQCTYLHQQERAIMYEWVKENELCGNRVLAVAVKIIKDVNLPDDIIRKYDTAYDTLGLISFADPLKSTAASAIKKAQSLGVQIKVLSGDSVYVCFTIAEQLGLENNIDNVVLGSDFEKLSEEQKMFFVYNRTIFARVTPEQKYQIIAYLQRKYAVGYIGDGINDAPALKIAHVGIAVRDAADVAREAAEIIMLQKSLLNILLGIEEGRKIIINTLKYIKITISSNVGHFYSLAFSSLLINYLPMLPLQLLFLDLVTDFPLIAISTDAVTKNELQKPLSYSMKDISFVTFLFGLVSSPFDFMIFSFFKLHPAVLQTNWFISSALTQLVLIFSLRTQQPFWRAHHPSLALLGFCCIAAIVVIMLPFTSLGQTFFSFVRPSMHDMKIISGIVLAYFLTTETVKVLYYHTYTKKL
ncbi:MAG TPA: HAD-IC family P-type ATPase [Candidatus Babeliales bacterium]|nr:HAD-IC family P-type ATPase [Candidatus Babeliales bacterium]